MELTGATAVKGVVVVGGGSVSGYGIYTLSSVGNESYEFEPSKNTNTSELLVPSEPDFLFQAKDFGDYESTTFGYAYGRFMLNPDGESEKWEENEKDFELLEADTDSQLSDKFKDLRKIEGGDERSLQQICKEIYKKTKTEVENGNGLWNDVWGFCSVSKYPPFNVSEDNTNESKYKGRWALKEDNGKGLFSTYSWANDQETWNHVFKNILKEDIDNKDKKSSISSQFTSISSGSELLNVCEAAYKSASTAEETDYGRNVREYCMLDASVSLSQYPTEPGK